MGGQSLFERTIAVQARGAGCYGGSVQATWNGPAAPNGGVLAATLLAAAQAELGPGAPPPRTVAAHFLEAPAPGPVELAVSVLRRGKRVVMCDVRMRQDARVAVQATIIFSAARPDLISLRREMPPVPPPDPARVLGPGALPGAPPIFAALDIQPTFGRAPFSGASEAICGGWTAMRGDPGPVDGARLVALSDVWYPAVFPRLATFAAVPTLQMTVNLRSCAPVPWPVLARFRTRHLADGHLEEQGEIFSADGELLAESTQLALLLPL